jgi:hypothetical protein
MKKKFDALKGQYENVAKLNLKPGKKYYYKFLIKGEYKHDPTNRCVKNEFGTFDNEIFIDKFNSNESLYEKNKNK